jgi:DNA-binding MarR family transcriptional regulator
MITSTTLATILERARPLHSTSLNALAILDSQGDQTLGSLTVALGINSASVTGLADSLETQGLAKRTRREGDRRTIYLTLTDLGRQTVQDILTAA